MLGDVTAPDYKPQQVDKVFQDCHARRQIVCLVSALLTTKEKETFW